MKAKYWLGLIAIFVIIFIVWKVASRPEYEVKGVGFDDAPAQVVITEYADFQCPACGTAYPVLKQVKEAYSREQVKIEYKHFPLKQIHPFAYKAAQASECARDQEKFQEYHDTLFEHQQDLRPVSLKKYAAELGLDTEAFNACLDSSAVAGRVDGNLDEGIKAGVKATPSFVISGTRYEGVLSFDRLKGIIDSQVKNV